MLKTSRLDSSVFKTLRERAARECKQLPRYVNIFVTLGRSGLHRRREQARECTEQMQRALGT